jgi:hypothetical protein
MCDCVISCMEMEFVSTVSDAVSILHQAVSRAVRLHGVLTSKVCSWKSVSSPDMDYCSDSLQSDVD